METGTALLTIGGWIAAALTVLSGMRVQARAERRRAREAATREAMTEFLSALGHFGLVRSELTPGLDEYSSLQKAVARAIVAEPRLAQQVADCMEEEIRELINHPTLFDHETSRGLLDQLEAPPDEDPSPMVRLLVAMTEVLYPKSWWRRAWTRAKRRVRNGRHQG